MNKREHIWYTKYMQLKNYVEKNKHLPNKNKVENRGLLNWWKYNQKTIKEGKLSKEKINLLTEIDKLRQANNTTPSNNAILQ